MTCSACLLGDHWKEEGRSYLALGFVTEMKPILGPKTAYSEAATSARRTRLQVIWGIDWSFPVLIKSTNVCFVSLDMTFMIIFEQREDCHTSLRYTIKIRSSTKSE